MRRELEVEQLGNKIEGEVNVRPPEVLYCVKGINKRGIRQALDEANEADSTHYRAKPGDPEFRLAPSDFCSAFPPREHRPCPHTCSEIYPIPLRPYLFEWEKDRCGGAYGFSVATGATTAAGTQLVGKRTNSGMHDDCAAEANHDARSQGHHRRLPEMGATLRFLQGAGVLGARDAGQISAAPDLALFRALAAPLFLVVPHH